MSRLFAPLALHLRWRKRSNAVDERNLHTSFLGQGGNICFCVDLAYKDFLPSMHLYLQVYNSSSCLPKIDCLTQWLHGTGRSGLSRVGRSFFLSRNQQGSIRFSLGITWRHKRFDYIFRLSKIAPSALERFNENGVRMEMQEDNVVIAGPSWLEFGLEYNERIVDGRVEALESDSFS